MTNSFKKKASCLKTRSLVIQAIRDFFVRNNYLEIDTPIRCPSIIPEAQIDPVTSENHFLQASPELCMKRLLSKGFDRIFQICKCFRKNERSAFHLPEMTLLEWYAKGFTYLDLMQDCENMIRSAARAVYNEETIQYQGVSISLDPPWKRLTVEKAFQKFAGKSMAEALSDNTFDEVISFEIEPHLGRTHPVFLMDYPRQYASLARTKPGNTELAERFELYIAGIELANAFTELTDAAEQRNRFRSENNDRISQGFSPLPIPEKFLTDLENLGDAAGIAMGIDRLVMLFCDTVSIDDVTAFVPETL